MEPAAVIILSAAAFIIVMVIFYFVVKEAVRQALKEHDELAEIRRTALKAKDAEPAP